MTDHEPQAGQAMWRIETVSGALVRSAALAAGPPLWLVHALGDSSVSYVPLFSTPLSPTFELHAPDLLGAGATPPGRHADGLESISSWLAGVIQDRTPVGPIGLVGHSLGASIAVRVARLLAGRVVGLFSIEGNLTEADGYLSGLATRFEAPEDFHRHVLEQLRTKAAGSPPPQGHSLWLYHANFTLSEPRAVWTIGRDATRASRRNRLGAEYLSLDVPTLYYWSPENTPLQTQDFLRRHRIQDVQFCGGHWPMVENPADTAAAISAFFQPLFV